MVNARNFRCGGRKGSGRVGKVSQLMVAPLKIAPRVRSLAEILVFVSMLFVGCSELLFAGDQISVVINRME